MKAPFVSMPKLASALALVLGMAVTNAQATVVDLTIDNSGTISDGTNTVTFVFDKLQPSGTGVLDPFVRIQNDGTEQGYNTTQDNAAAYPFDEKHGSFTHDVLFSSLQLIDGFYNFVLDIAEGGNSPESLLSLDGLKLYAAATGGQDTTVLADLGILLWDMDGDEDSFVLLDGNRDGNPGNGVSDMLMKVPEIVFADVNTVATPYFILWSQFGLQEGAVADALVPGSGTSNSFEEWALLEIEDGGGPPQEEVPEPGVLLLMGAGLLGLGLARRRKSV